MGVVAVSWGLFWYCFNDRFLLLWVLLARDSSSTLTMFVVVVVVDVGIPYELAGYSVLHS